ncbi:hypothetical protein [Lentibacillus halodurans]|nr:hypothetical protein [Lentibacillus halodurans]
MKPSLLVFSLIFTIYLVIGLMQAEAKPNEGETKQHNWQEYSTHYETVDAGSHEYTYWKNFIERTRTCDISHKLKSVVYYCDLHDHTDSQIFLEETIHSEKHK